MNPQEISEERSLLRPHASDITGWLRENTYVIKQDPNKQGYVLKIEGDQKYIVKIETTEAIDTEQITNEAFVGYFGVNSLNYPNFSKTLAFNLEEKCSVFKGYEYEREQCGFLVSEFINGPTLNKYLQTANVAQLKKVYMDIIEALFFAYQEIKFTHFDLHAGNIIISSSNGVEIPVIIDYGTSRIEYNGKMYGGGSPVYVRRDGTHVLLSEEDIQKIYNKPMWFFDIIKLLLSSYCIIDNATYNYLKLLKEISKEEKSRDLVSSTLENYVKVNDRINIRRIQGRLNDINEILNILYEKRKEIDAVEPEYYPIDFLPYLSKLLYPFFQQDVSTEFLLDFNEFFTIEYDYNTDLTFQEYRDYAISILSQ